MPSQDRVSSVKLMPSFEVPRQGRMHVQDKMPARIFSHPQTSHSLDLCSWARAPPVLLPGNLTLSTKPMFFSSPFPNYTDRVYRTTIELLVPEWLSLPPWKAVTYISRTCPSTHHIW